MTRKRLFCLSGFIGVYRRPYFLAAIWLAHSTAPVRLKFFALSACAAFQGRAGTLPQLAVFDSIFSFQRPTNGLRGELDFVGRACLVAQDESSCSGSLFGAVEAAAALCAMGSGTFIG